jgi:hypothetical protein
MSFTLSPQFREQFGHATRHDHFAPTPPTVPLIANRSEPPGPRNEAPQMQQEHVPCFEDSFARSSDSRARTAVTMRSKGW